MESQMEKVALGLAGKGFRVSVYATTCSFAGEPGVRWFRVHAPKPMPLRLPTFAIGAWWRLRTGRPDVLFTTGAIVPVRAEYSVVHFCHRAYRDREGARQPSRPGMHYRLSAWVAEAISLCAERFLYRPAWNKHLVAVSETLASDLRVRFPYGSDGVVVVPNGVDVGRFASTPKRREESRARFGLPEGVLVALFVGGDWERKGLSLALEAMSMVQNWSLLIVGRGDEEKYRTLAEELGVGERVYFFGRQSDTAPFYWAADVLVHPSRYETFGLVFLEALAAGLGIVTTVENELVSEMERLGAAVRVKREGRDVAEALGRISARRRDGWEDFLDHYTWETVVGEYASLVLEAQGGTTP